MEYAGAVARELDEAEMRVEIDDRNERMNAKIRDAQLQKVPYMLVVGDKEAEANTVNVRLRNGENLGALPVADLLRRMEEEIKKRG